MRKFVVIPGNNPGVIKRAVAKRGNWDDVKTMIAWSNPL